MAYQDISHEPTSTLIQHVIDDLRDLFREEVALARAEIRDEASGWGAAAARIGAGAAVLAVGALFVLIAIALGVSVAFRWPAWGGFLLVGIVLAIVGGIALQMGRTRARRITMLPKTAESIKETSAWMKHRINSSAR